MVLPMPDSGMHKCSNLPLFRQDTKDEKGKEETMECHARYVSEQSFMNYEIERYSDCKEIMYALFSSLFFVGIFVNPIHHEIFSN